MNSLKISTIIGSIRPNRFADKPAQWIYEQTKKIDGVEAQLLDLKDFPMPFFDELMSSARLNRMYSHDIVKKWSEKIMESDAFIMVSPEYNHSTSGVLKNAMDWLFPEWHKKAVGFVSYGSVGGARAVEHLRLISVELEMAPIRSAVHIPGNIMAPIIMGKAEWGAETEAGLKDSADKMLSQLVWWAKALKVAREQE